MSESAALSRRSFGKAAKPTTLASAIDNATTTLTFVDGSTYPDGSLGPFMITLDLGLPTEERVEVPSRTGNVCTGCVRGADGTTQQSHSTTINGVTETSTARDFDEANKLVAAMANNSCRVYNNAAISVTDSAFQALTFNSERFDSGGLHSTSANTGRLTAVTAGKYLIFGGAECATNATGERIINLRLNGTTFIASATVLPSSANATRLSIATVYPLAAADFVELLVFQSSGGFLNVNAAGNYSPEFGCSLIGL